MRALIPLEDLITSSLELMLGTGNLKSTNLDGGKKECTSEGKSHNLKPVNPSTTKPKIGNKKGELILDLSCFSC